MNYCNSPVALIGFSVVIFFLSQTRTVDPLQPEFFVSDSFFFSLREELFYGLTLLVEQFKSLSDSLIDGYLSETSMTGINQFLCPQCACKVSFRKWILLLRCFVM